MRKTKIINVMKNTDKIIQLYIIINNISKAIYKKIYSKILVIYYFKNNLSRNP